MVYNINKADNSKIRALSATFSLDMLKSTIICRRGMDDRESLKFLFESDMVYQHSPFLFYDMESAVERINDAIAEEERIFIFGDRDTDGITSTAILYKELKRLGAKDVITRLPQNDEPYGLTSDIVGEVLDQGSTLLITVDNGISSIEEIKILADEGVDTIILDHHLAGSEFPPAVAIIDPKIEGSGYPFNGLAGCAVAFKLCWALRFSRTPLYQSSFIFFHATPGSDSVKMSAVKITNLVEEDECYEELATGLIPHSESRMIKFLNQGLPIVVMDKDQEAQILSQAFSDRIEIVLNDVRREIESIITSVRGKSLFTLSNISRSVKYSERDDKELDTLISLFRSTMLYKNKSAFKDIEDSLILASIGTVADLMPMKNENRIIVKQGLKYLEKNTPDYMRAILAHFELVGKKITSKDISFSIAPLINSSGRLGKPQLALSLFLCEDRKEIERITEELINMNKERKTSTEEILSSVKDEAELSLSYFQNRLILVEKGVPRGLTGSIASRMLSQSGKPTIILANTGDGRISASMRTKRNFNAREFLDNLSFLFQDFGGHACAAGFSMAEENMETFRSELSCLVANLPETEEVISNDVDAEIPENYMNQEIWKIKEFFEPYGQENESLHFHIKRAKIDEVYPNRNGGSYLRFTLKYNNQIWPSVFWEYDKTKEVFSPGDFVELIFTPEVNTYKGLSRLQLNIIEMEKAN